MELYLFAALVLMYILMAIFVRKNVQLKVWTTAYIVSFIVTAIAIAFLHVNRQDVMISVDQLNWYYLLYLLVRCPWCSGLSTYGCSAKD